MAPHTTNSTARRNAVAQRHFIPLARHITLFVLSEAILTLLGVSLWIRIAVEVVAMGLAWLEVPRR